MYSKTFTEIEEYLVMSDLYSFIIESKNFINTRKTDTHTNTKERNINI